MQEKKAKILGLGIMENNASLSSSVESLIEKFKFGRDSEHDVLLTRKLTIQSTNTGHRNNITKESEPDIDKNITELENLIKRLQAEIVEMSATASKSISLHGSIIAQKEDSSKSNIKSKTQEVSYELSKMSNKVTVLESQNDGGVLEDQVEMCSENDSKTINGGTDFLHFIDAFEDVRRDLSVLWDDTTKTSNLDVAEKPIETGINNVCKVFEGTDPSDKISPNNTRDDNKIIKGINNNNEFYVNSITNGVLSEIHYENVTENIMDNVPVLLIAETPSTLSVKNMSNEIKESDIEKHPSNLINKTDLKSSATDLPKPGTVAAIKTKMENLGSSDNTSTPVPNQVIPTPVTCELLQTQSVNTEKTVQDIPKTDSLLKTFNRKLRQIVGITSEKSILQDKNDSEDNFTSGKDILKTIPKSKSEPRKDFFTSDEDSSKIGPKNTDIPVTQEKIKISNSMYNNVIAAEKSMGFMNIVKKIIPSLVSNDLPDNEDDPSEDGPRFKNFMEANLKTTDNIVNPINTANDPQIINPEKLVDEKPNVSIKNPDPDMSGSGTTSSGFRSMIPKFFGSDIKTDELMKVQVEEKKVENTEEQNKEQTEEKKEDDEEADKEDEEDDGDEEEGGDDDDDDDDETYDVD